MARAIDAAHAAVVLLAATAGCFKEPPIEPLSADSASGGEHDTDTEDWPDELPTGGDASAGGSSAGESEGSTGAHGHDGDGSESTGGELGESSSTGDEPAHPYQDCFDGPVADGVKLCDGPCIVDEPEYSACAPGCIDEPCPGAPQGSPVCLGDVTDELAALVCVLDCTAGAPCPAGMDCRPTEYTAGGETLFACMWK